MAVRKATSRKRSTATKRTASAESPKKRAPKTRNTVTKRAADEATLQPPLIARPTPARPAAALAAVEHDTPADGRPSRFTGDYYIHATGPQPAEGAPRKPGKWLIFVSRSRIDATWESIRRALTTGRLGHAAKVSTALPNPMSPDPKKHVICVYTHDEDDVADVRRVRDVLRGIGITWKIPYKSDAGTTAGQYEVTTGGPAAKYYE